LGVRGLVLHFAGAVCDWAEGDGRRRRAGTRPADGWAEERGESYGKDGRRGAAGDADDRMMAPSIETGDCPQYVGSNARRAHKNHPFVGGEGEGAESGTLFSVRSAPRTNPI